MIIPFQSSQSRLLDILRGTDDEVEQMPPHSEGEPLKAEEIELIAKWINLGAIGNERETSTTVNHWAYQPILLQKPPTNEDSSWINNSIDSFVFSKLAEHEISPAPRASRETLIRRLSLDLRGLLPSPEETEHFLNSRSPAAYEELVDSFLASPHFGERWGRHWLDLARYADTDGYEKDGVRPNAWRYRDWVIDALNNDLPFDQFSTLQLAADLNPSGVGRADIVATGFHRNTLHNTEGGVDREEDRFKKTIDRTNTFGSIWLGMTVGCAQCHTHKYDPITQREYYSLYGFFNQLEEVNVPAMLPRDQLAFERAQESYLLKKTSVERQLDEYLETFSNEQLENKLQEILSQSTTWLPLEMSKFESAQGATLTQLDDQSILATATNLSSDTYNLTFAPISRPQSVEDSNSARLSSSTIRGVSEDPSQSNSKLVTAVRLEVLPDDSLPNRGPGRASNGNFVLTNFVALRLLSHSESDQAQDEGNTARVSLREPIEFTKAQANYSQPNWDVAQAINQNPSDGWAIGPRMGRSHVAVFYLAKPVDLRNAQLEIELAQVYSGTPHNLGRFRISVTTQTGELQLQSPPTDLDSIARLSPAERSDAQQKRLQEFILEKDPRYRELNDQLETLTKSEPSPNQFMARAVREINNRRQTTMFVRGDFLRPGDIVDPGTPQVLPNLTNSPSPTRLDLAAWTFSKENPLTARVTANRIWARLFGAGLIETLDDFGTQAKPPTHPQLLDWLAYDLGSDWSVKRLVRTIVLSRTYQQNSAMSPELLDLDPNNGLLARQNRRRVEAEIIRDLALQTSQLLDDRIGGPSVRPPQPTEYSSLTYANSAKWKVSQNGDAYRRGMYTFFQRTSPYPMLTTFDCPDSNQTATRRESSNTPIQSLTLWNDPVFMECAIEFGNQIFNSAHSAARQQNGSSVVSNSLAETRESPNNKRIRFAFKLALTRSPSLRETQILLDTFSQTADHFLANPKLAQELLGKASSDWAESEASEMAERAAWVIVARTIMNLDEFIMRN